MMKDSFSTYHPLVNFIYFTFVIVFSMVFMNPACLCISFACGVIYSFNLSGVKAFKKMLYMAIMFISAAIINPAFNHEGATILAYFPNGNPLTLESIAYGIGAAFMYCAVIYWFSNYTLVMTSDKFVYLFGRLIPSLSLILSMVLRFVPKFRAQLETVTNAQKCIGRDVSVGGFFQRIKQGLRILSIMVTWMLENAIETADSMKSRGYGLKGRTAFSIYNFELRDKIAILFLIFSAAYIIIGALQGALYFRYYPTIKSVSGSFYTVSVLIVYGIMCLAPVAINIWEDRKWKYLQSSI